MLTRAQLLRGAAVALPALALGSVARAETGQQTVINGAIKTLGDLRHDKAFGNAKELLRTAQAVMIVPRLWKGGFFVGGEGGQGVMMVRHGGGWSDPAFYVMGSASFGLQIGLEQAELIMLVMTERGVKALLNDEFKVGAQAGISVVTLGSTVGAAIAGATPPDIVVWASSTGLYGGLTINGSIIKPQPSDDRAFYGRAVTNRDVLYGKTPSGRASALTRELARLA